MVSLPVRDVGVAVRFYVETLGMKLVEETDPRTPAWAVIDAGEGFLVALRRGGEAGSAAGGGARVGLAPKIPIAEAVTILENRGVVFAVTKERDVTVASFQDPDGNTLYLYQRA